MSDADTASQSQSQSQSQSKALPEHATPTTAGNDNVHEYALSNADDSYRAPPTPGKDHLVDNIEIREYLETDEYLETEEYLEHLCIPEETDPEEEFYHHHPEARPQQQRTAQKRPDGDSKRKSPSFIVLSDEEEQESIDNGNGEIHDEKSAETVKANNPLFRTIKRNGMNHLRRTISSDSEDFDSQDAIAKETENKIGNGKSTNTTDHARSSDPYSTFRNAMKSLSRQDSFREDSSSGSTVSNNHDGSEGIKFGGRAKAKPRKRGSEIEEDEISRKKSKLPCPAKQSMAERRARGELTETESEISEESLLQEANSEQQREDENMIEEAVAAAKPEETAKDVVPCKEKDGEERDATNQAGKSIDAATVTDSTSEPSTEQTTTSKRSAEEPASL
jgi:hypothetical protein